MTITRSKLTSRGRTSVPARVRQKLGLAPGSALEWDEQDGLVVVRKAGRYTWEDVHHALFPEGVARGEAVDVKEGIRKYIRKRHARV